MQEKAEKVHFCIGLMFSTTHTNIVPAIIFRINTLHYSLTNTHKLSFCDIVSKKKSPLWLDLVLFSEKPPIPVGIF